MMKKILAAALLTFLSLSVNAAAIDGAAPNFKLKTLDGKAVKLSALKGKVVMINFWASWCGPCRQEMPLLQEIYSDYRKAGFVLLAVNLDEDVSEAKKFLKGMEISFPILLDPEGSVADLYKNQAMPSSYFVNREGNLAHLHRGYRPGEEKDYRKTILKLLAE